MTKKTYQINTNRGVDLSSSPLSVAPSRASYMRNMISKGGINHKRNGWNEIAMFEDAKGNALAINGIWEYVHPDTREKSLIVYAGTRFYKCNYDFSEQKKIDVEKGANVNDEKCKAYYKDGLLWIIGCGDFLVYDGESISRVENSKYVHVPTTSIGITAAGIENDNVITSYEDVNLLTKRRKNKMVGASKYAEGEKDFRSVYDLDGLVDFTEPVKIYIEIMAGYYERENEVCLIATIDDENFHTTVLPDRSLITLEYTVYEKNTPVDYTATYKGKQVTLYEMLENGNNGDIYKAQVGIYEWPNSFCLTCLSNVVTPQKGYSNITVEYCADYERSINLTKSAMYTQPNGVDLLLVANKDNVIFYSGLDSADCEYSFGYIPAEKFITFGSDREPITDIVPMNDSVGVFKGNSFYRVSFTFNSDSETYEADYVPQITEATDTNGCVNQFVSCNVNGDTLVFDGAGVYGIEYSSSQRSLKLRSSNISKAFKQYSKDKLESAIACHHEGRYYLFINGDVYIADSRFKVYESNRLDTSFEYEWWVWDNCRATVACSIDGKLFLGKENGKIAVFDDKYSDRELLIAKSSANEVSCENDKSRHSILTFDKSMGVKVGDTVKIKGAYQQIGWDVPVTMVDGYAKVDSINVDGGYIGKKVIIGSTNEECEIIDFIADYPASYFLINATVCESTETIYCSIVDKKFTIGKFENNLCLFDGVGIACLAKFDEFEVIIEKSKNVECEYHTPVLDLGSNLSLKILNQLAITTSQETEGLVEIGYQTNSNNAFLQRRIGSAFDFNNFNFNSFAFDGAFYKTHVKRVFERNFNYILFKFASSSDSDFAIENFTCVFSSNNKLLRSDR